ncbi:MAG TPA: hypothetical protein VG795_10085 [Acidimicrobiia bacterium]|nr:hypothetical protein [Acidimicrobiia bacterium]
MRRIPFVTSIIAVATVLSMAVAFATPPSGDLKYTDLYRAQFTDSASVPIVGGTVLMQAAYDIESGGQTGWRRLPGTAVFSVGLGKLMIHGGEGCAAKEYAPGQAAVLPAGVYQFHNPAAEGTEDGQVSFWGLFFQMAPDAAEPLVDGPPQDAPATCSGVSGQAVSAPSGVHVKGKSAGTFVNSYGDSHAHHAGHDASHDPNTVTIEAGKDIFATLYDAAPGWSSGWFQHVPAVNIMHKGDLTYYEGRDGQCVKTETYHAGESFYHPTHNHMAVNEGKEHVLITSIYIGMPHDEKPPPVVGNQAGAADFSQPPPEGCSRLR